MKYKLMVATVLGIFMHVQTVYAQDSSAVRVTYTKDLIAHTKDLETCAFSKDGHYLASAGWDRDVKLISMDSANFGTVLKTFTGNQSGINKVVFSPDSKLIASAGKDFIARVWNIETQELLFSSFENNKEVTQLIFSPDSKILMTSSKDGTLRTYDLYNQQNNIPPKFINCGSTILDFAPTKSGKGFVIATAESNDVKFVNFKGAEVMSLQGHTSPINCVRYSPSYRYLASGSVDNTIIIWNAQTNVKIATLTGHTWQVNNIQWSYDERYLVTCSKSGETILYDVKEAKIIAQFKHKLTDALGVDISPDLQYIAVAGKNEETFKGTELYKTNLQKIQKKPAKKPTKNGAKPSTKPVSKTPVKPAVK